ncbi:hypothetical protein Bpfe_007437 [Biomphalaria pfeifferi]|uniref:Uncharacterized protein n=1 Tax=Biomphalaria pfeifferi TaxID=112525 RepID=A0AAD8BYV4_BIOPF|nr:hypothetical protein Bpfe_007437 [Biomphalaria pfeifferi]
MDDSERMKIEAKSASPHNMDLEEVVGMFSTEIKSPAVFYVSWKVLSKKKKTVAYLDSLIESALKESVECAIGIERITRQDNKMWCELILRRRNKRPETVKKRGNRLRTFLEQMTLTGLAQRGKM